MKKLIVIISVILLLSCIFVTPVFADDPPPSDTNVGIVIVTPGDTNVDIDINSGGNTNVNVDGTNMQQVSATAQEALNRWFGCNFMADYYYYWKITGIGPMVEGRLGNLEQSANATNNTLLITIMAINKLIQSDNLTIQQVAFLNQQLIDLANQQSGINNKLADRDSVIWNQLMNGAEYHLGILQGVVDEQGLTIIDLQRQLDASNEAINVANSNIGAQRDFTEYLRVQYLHYFWAAGAIGILLLSSVIVLFVKVLRIKRAM